MSTQSYYGYTNTQAYPQQPQYSHKTQHSLGNNPYSHGQGGYIPPYHDQADYSRSANHSYYHGQNEMTGPDGERGLGATVVGGGAAGWAAHKSGSGMLGSLASAAAGAIGANFLEDKLKKHRNKRHNK
ncbi:hypothetical protein V2G26_012582 [Clonostachys chloroleuca]|uniref:Glycine zipper 2TM domain-containing protein n=1 Tax=Clonostachys chloroleuca TaxID=1926264 RepID=A0AA35VA83_9HYPO|nr:unnamed protein product [Clonostachys chloroleuca]